jgi:hypothetical protein
VRIRVWALGEIYDWDPSKQKFRRAQVLKCLGWMRQHGYVPSGQGQRTTVLEKKSKLPSAKRHQRDESV